MNKEELYDYKDLFRNKALNNKLIIFVGSGVSKNVEGMPSWFELVKKMADEIGYSKRGTENNCSHSKDCPFVDDFSTDEMLKIPQYLFNSDPEKYYEILKNNIKHPKVNAPLSDAIFDVNPVHIITTNYDHLLEDSENELREQYQVIIHDKDLLESGKGKYIIKMHGDIDDVNSIVLKEDDYLKYSQTHVLIELFVKSLLVDHTVLFLGYSINDYNIKLIIGWLNYMRSQNGSAINKDTKIGYIILDESEIEERQIKYFGANNIGVININKITCVDDMPCELTFDKGRRLYSFVKYISKPSFEENVIFMSKHKYVNCWQILKFLNINSKFYICNGCLKLYNKSDFKKLTSFMETNENGAILRNLLINAGITNITHFHDEFEVGNLSNGTLFNSWFNLYLNNEYDKLLLNLKHDKTRLMEKYFYLSIICEYDNVKSLFEQIDFFNLNSDDQLAYLHNTAVLDNEWLGFDFRKTASGTKLKLKLDLSKIEKFINNMSSAREREFYSTYLDIYRENTNALYNNKSISSVELAYNNVFKIKNYAYSQYSFYFLNRLFFVGINNFRDFLHPYIEGIICANSEIAKVPSNVFDLQAENSKYNIGILDIDIMTKFIDSEDLQILLSTYKTVKLNVSDSVVRFLVNCLVNLANYLINQHKYGYCNSFIDTISNLAILLSLVEIGIEEKNKIAETVQKLFLDKNFCQYFFSEPLLERPNYIKAFSNLCSKLYMQSNLNVIQTIMSTTGFRYYASIDHLILKMVCGRYGLTDINLVREMVLSFVDKDNFEQIEPQIIAMIDKTTDIKDKLLLLQIFFRLISNNDFKKKITQFLSGNFTQLTAIDIADFMDCDWITLSQDNINQLFNEILALAKQCKNNSTKRENLLDDQILKVYILYLKNVIEDVSKLEELANNYPHLQFLLNPDSFDYSQVDFTDYMWKNFVRYPKTREHFIAHKDTINKHLKNKLKSGTITESEKEILYRFFLSDDENLLN